MTRQHRRHQIVQRRRIAHDLRLEFKPFALGENRDAVVADGSAQDDPVARPRLAGRQPHAVRDDSDSGGVDEKAVALALSDHLGVAGHDRDAGGGGRFRHRGRNAAQSLRRKILLPE